MTRHLRLAAACCATCLALACGSPTDPGPLERPLGGSGIAGETAKVGAPFPVSPRDGQLADGITPTLRVNNSRGIYIPGLPIELVVEVYDVGDRSGRPSTRATFRTP